MDLIKKEIKDISAKIQNSYLLYKIPLNIDNIQINNLFQRKFITISFILGKRVLLIDELVKLLIVGKNKEVEKTLLI